MAENIIWKDDTVTTTDDLSKVVEGPTTLEYIPKFGEVRNKGTEIYDGTEWLSREAFAKNEYKGQYLYGGGTAKKLKETAVGLYEGARDLEEKITPQFVKDHNQIQQEIMMQALSQGVSLVGKSYQALPPKGKEAVQTFGSGVKWTAEQTDKSILGWSHKLGTTPILTEALFTAAEFAFTAGTGPGGRKLLQEVLTSKQALRPAYVANRVVDGSGLVRQGADDLTKILNQPMQIASNLQATPTVGQSTYGSLRTLIRDGRPQSLQKARKILESGWGGKLSKKNTLISIDKLIGTDEGRVLLNRMMDRSEAIERRFGKFDTLLKLGKKTRSELAQRELYDVAAKNLFDASELIYGQKGARKYLANITKWFTKDEWHHIFGNKEAGEFLLSQVAQDPVVAINLFKKMDELKLFSSGISQNIAVTKQVPHKAIHRWYVKHGFQGGAADFGELGRELGEAIVRGEANVNDLFRMLELHADFNTHVRGLIKSGEFGKYGEEITFMPDLKPGVRDALARGGYRASGPSKQDAWYKGGGFTK